MYRASRQFQPLCKRRFPNLGIITMQARDDSKCLGMARLNMGTILNWEGTKERIKGWTGKVSPACPRFPFIFVQRSESLSCLTCFSSLDSSELCTCKQANIWLVWCPISEGGLDFEYARSTCQFNGNNLLELLSTLCRWQCRDNHEFSTVDRPLLLCPSTVAISEARQSTDKCQLRQQLYNLLILL